MKILAATAATVLVGAVLVAAEEPATFGVGSRVRVRVQEGPRGDGPDLVGRMVASDADTFTLSLAQGGTKVVPWSTVRKIEVSRGRRSVGSGLLRGAGIGLAVGVVGGALVGVTGADDSPCRPDEWLCIRFDATESAAIGAVVLGTAGTAVGAAVGGAVRGERWTRVREPQLSLAPTSGPGGRGTGLALRFAF